MDISDKDLLNKDSLLVPATQQTQSPNSFSSVLIRHFSLKSSQVKLVSAETVINNTKTECNDEAGPSKTDVVLPLVLAKQSTETNLFNPLRPISKEKA